MKKTLFSIDNIRIIVIIISIIALTVGTARLFEREIHQNDIILVELRAQQDLLNKLESRLWQLKQQSKKTSQ